MSEPSRSTGGLAATNPAAGPPAGRVVASDELLGREKSVWIRHAGEFYRLSVTKQGKLILTK